MRQNKTKQMLNYWMGLYEEAGNRFQPSGQHIWPERSDVQPADCRRLLSDMFILEINRGAVEYRLAGTNLCNLYGRELKREAFCEAYEGADQRSAENWAAQLGMDKVVALICSLGENARGELVNLETLLLPLSHHGNPSKRVLGITVPCDAPDWLYIHPVISQHIRSVRVLTPWEDEMERASNSKAILRDLFNPPEAGFRPLVSAPPVQPGSGLRSMTEGQDPFLTRDEITGGFEPIRKVGHLQVIKGGRED